MSMTLQEKIDVMTAYQRGQKIQFRAKDYDDDIRFYGTGWRDSIDAHGYPNGTQFNFPHYDYRIKPEPREGWVYTLDICETRGSGGRIRMREVV